MALVEMVRAPWELQRSFFRWDCSFKTTPYENVHSRQITNPASRGQAIHMYQCLLESELVGQCENLSQNRKATTD